MPMSLPVSANSNVTKPVASDMADVSHSQEGQEEEAFAAEETLNILYSGKKIIFLSSSNFSACKV